MEKFGKINGVGKARSYCRRRHALAVRKQFFGHLYAIIVEVSDGTCAETLPERMQKRTFIDVKHSA